MEVKMSIATRFDQVLPAGTWKLDPVDPQVSYAVKHAGVSLFRGGVDGFDAGLVEGTLAGSANVTGITVQDENMSAHLLSPEFFDAERFPNISFTTTDVHGDGDNLDVDGELEMRGLRKAIHLTGTIAGPANGRIGISLQSTLDRTDFGMNWNTELPDGTLALDNEITLTADLELVEDA
jgi:polyisoprenoid-binding protein YceI